MSNVTDSTFEWIFNRIRFSSCSSDRKHKMLELYERLITFADSMHMTNIKSIGSITEKDLV